MVICKISRERSWLDLPGSAAAYTRTFAKILIPLYRKLGDYQKAKDLQKALRQEQDGSSWFSRLKPKI